MEITIRNARIEDFDAVTRIMNQVQQLMHLALGKIEELYPGLPVKLTVRPFNKRAIKCYESVGFKIVEKYYESTYLVPGEMYIMELNRCL